MRDAGDGIPYNIRSVLKLFNKKSFIAGIITGIVLVIAVNTLYRAAATFLPWLLFGEMSVQQKIDEIFNILDEHYVYGYEREDLIEGVFAGLVAKLGDPNTSYMSAENMAGFFQRIDGSYAGIGVVVSVDPKDNRIIVLEAYKGAPGERAGILAGDKFIMVNDIPIPGDILEEAVAMIKGPPGTPVTITVLRESDGSIFDTEIIREIVNIPTVSHKMMDDNIGYIRLFGFDRVTTGQFKEAYDDLNAQGMEGLILDVRNNSGGLLDVVVSITDMLVAADYILYTVNRGGEREYIYASGEGIEMPLVVLVNGNSASASEVLAGAVKDTNTGVLVGTQTFGKGSVQNIFRMADGSGVRVTVSKYYTPSGISIDREGITPDYIVELTDYEDDAQLQKAAEIILGMLSYAE